MGNPAARLNRALMKALRSYGALFKQAGRGWVDDNAPSMGAALAFYSAFALAPLLLIASAVAGMVFGHRAARSAVMARFEAMIGPAAGHAVERLIATAARVDTGLIASAIGVLLLLVGASGVLVELQTDLNRIWRAPPRAATAWTAMLLSRLLAFALILAMGFLLMLSLAVDTALAALLQSWQPLASHAVLVGAVHLSVTVVLFSALFALLYKSLPNVSLSWRDTLWGSVITAVLFTAGQVGIGLYLARSTMTSAYAAAGSVLVLLLWLYYASQIVLFGAELTWAYAQRRRATAARSALKRAAAHGPPDPGPPTAPG